MKCSRIGKAYRVLIKHPLIFRPIKASLMCVLFAALVFSILSFIPAPYTRPPSGAILGVIFAGLMLKILCP